MARSGLLAKDAGALVIRDLAPLELTACESGTRDAPNTPCSSGAATMPPSEVAMPHSAEATVTLLTISLLLLTRRPGSAPSGAAAEVPR